MTTPSLKRLQSFANITIVIGPLLLVLGFVFIRAIGIIGILGGAVALFGGILLLAGLVSRAVELGVRSLGEAAAERDRAAGEASVPVD